MAKKHIKSRPGLFGMVHYYDENGKHIGKSRPGLLGGTRVYTDNDGKRVGKSRPGFFAKEVFTDTDNNRITTYDGLFSDVHYKNGSPAGHTRPGFFGYTHTSLEDDEEVLTVPQENADASEEILYGDSEEHISEKPLMTKYTIVDMLRSLAIFLFILMIAICIYAIIEF